MIAESLFVEPDGRNPVVVASESTVAGTDAEPDPRQPERARRTGRRFLGSRVDSDIGRSTPGQMAPSGAWLT